MATNPSVKIGFGFILDVTTQEFSDHMSETFSATSWKILRHRIPAASFIDEYFPAKYLHLSFDKLTDPDGKFTQVVVYSDHWQELYGNTLEGQEATAGAIYPEDVTPPKVLPFKKFMEDFGITHPPKVVVWTRWA